MYGRHLITARVQRRACVSFGGAAPRHSLTDVCAVCFSVCARAGILMDASMDVMDGMECTRVIRAQQLPHRVRPFIIAQTGQQRTHTHRSGARNIRGGPNHGASCLLCVQPM